VIEKKIYIEGEYKRNIYKKTPWSGTTTKKNSGSGRGPLSFVSTTEELLDRKVEAPV
jgi:hypothetical protein